MLNWALLFGSVSCLSLIRNSFEQEGLPVYIFYFCFCLFLYSSSVLCYFPSRLLSLTSHSFLSCYLFAFTPWLPVFSSVCPLVQHAFLYLLLPPQFVFLVSSCCPMFCSVPPAAFPIAQLALLSLSCAGRPAPYNGFWPWSGHCWYSFSFLPFNK